MTPNLWKNEPTCNGVCMDVVINDYGEIEPCTHEPCVNPEIHKIPEECLCRVHYELQVHLEKETKT